METRYRELAWVSILMLGNFLIAMKMIWMTGLPDANPAEVEFHAPESHVLYHGSCGYCLPFWQP